MLEVSQHLTSTYGFWSSNGRKYFKRLVKVLVHTHTRSVCTLTVGLCAMSGAHSWNNHQEEDMFNLISLSLQQILNSILPMCVIYYRRNFTSILKAPSYVCLTIHMDACMHAHIWNLILLLSQYLILYSSIIRWLVWIQFFSNMII